MPPSTDDNILKLISAALQRGESRSQISTSYQVSPRNITRISANLKKYGSPKAPPSGLKQGRPVKMTREQAEAMLAWMAGKDHTFFVKHLTDFLQERYDFKGCDGTVRRAIVRAGYSRQLPWHKNQITSWTPPDGPPDLSFVYNANPPNPSARRRARKGAAAATANLGSPSQEANDLNGEEKNDPDHQADENGAMQIDSAQGARQQEHGEIDPALRDLGSGLDGSSLANGMPNSPSQTRGSQQVSQAPTAPMAQMSTTLPVDQPAVFLDPQLSHQTIQPSKQTKSPILARTAPVKRQARSSKKSASSGGCDQPLMPTQTDEITLMQSQLEQQARLIAQLQQQLSSQQGAAPDQRQSISQQHNDRHRRSDSPSYVPNRVGGEHGGYQDDEDDEDIV